MRGWLPRNYRSIFPFFFALGLALVLGVGLASAQDNDFCFECHSDTDLTAERHGVEISAFVDQTAFENSLHGDLECIVCHADLDPEDMHEDDVDPVDCGMCHDSEAKQHADSLHGKAASRGNGRAPTCAGCHGAHAIQHLADEDVGCATCHQRQGRQHDASLHGKAAQRGDPMAPSCTDCHG